jgi:nondiscriminating glutamyl-tRNA synthetase
VNFLKPFLEKAGADVSDSEKTSKIILAVQKKIERGDQIYEAARIFYKDELVITEPEALEIIAAPTAKTVLTAIAEKIADLDELNNDTFRQVMKEVQKETGVKGAELWKPIRIALTGETSGPELPNVIDIFGKEKVLNFIRQTLTIIDK